MGHGHHAALLADIRDQHPALELWIDAGIRGYEDYTAWRQRRLGRIVIGSESLREADLFERLAREGEAPVLSLDYRGEAALGAAALFADPSRWPEDVIVMTLGRVGSGAGPDRQRLDAIRELAGGRRIYAAGGVRHGDDLAALQRSGIAGALIATALHSGAIGRAQLGALPSG